MPHNPILVALVAASTCALLLSTTSALAVEQLTLEQAQAEAVANTEAAQLLELEVRAARANEDIALGSLLPVLSASATGILNQEEVTAGQQTFVNQFDWSASIDLTVDLFRGPAIAEYMARSHESRAAELWYEWDSASLRLTTGRAYLAALTASRNVEAARESVALNRATLEQTEIRLETGYGLAADVARARLAVTEAEVAQLEAERARDNALDVLAFLTGRDDVPAEALVDPGISRGRSLQAALAQETTFEERLDIQALVEQSAAAEDRLLGRWLDFLPIVRLQASYDFGRPSIRAPDGTFWSISLNATWIIFDYTRYGQLDRARVEVERSELVRSEQLRTLDRDQRTALRTVEQAEAEIASLEAAVATALESRDLILILYQAGDATALELTEADTAVLRARIRLNQARLELERAWLELDWLEGRLSDPSSASSAGTP